MNTNNNVIEPNNCSINFNFKSNSDIILKKCD